MSTGGDSVNPCIFLKGIQACKITVDHSVAVSQTMNDHI